MGVLRRHWNAWRLHARLEGTLAQYQAKIEAKKQQLYQVQQMFRSFAAQLEAGLREDFTDHKLAKIAEINEQEQRGLRVFAQHPQWQEYAEEQWTCNAHRTTRGLGKLRQSVA